MTRGVVAGLALLAASGCVRSPGAGRPVDARAAVRATIDSLHSIEQRAHLTRDPELLVSLLADSLTMVDGGKVTRPSRAETLERFRGYFARVRFRHWDDLEPRAIRVSGDGTLATVTVRKRVDVVAADDSTAEEHDVFAWLEVWERRPEGWRIVSIASTRTP